MIAVKKRNMNNYEFETRNESVIPHIDVYVIDENNKIFIGYIVNNAFMKANNSEIKLDMEDLNMCYRIAYKLNRGVILKYEV